MHDHDLVGEQIHLGGGQGRRAFHERQLGRFHSQPQALDGLRGDRFQPGYNTVGPALRFLKRMQRNLSFPQRPEEDADEPRRLEADDNALSQLGVFDLPADLQVRKSLRHGIQTLRSSPVRHESGASCSWWRFRPRGNSTAAPAHGPGG